MAKLLWAAYLAAVLIRLWISSTYGAALGNRVELSSPLTSFKRLQEGLYLEAQAPGTAYSGWAFHQPPLILAFFIRFLPVGYTRILWLLVDLFAAMALHSITKRVLTEDATQKHSVEPQRVTPAVVSNVPHVAAIVYLLHPYGWLSNAALSLTMFDNLVVLGALLFAQKGHGSMVNFGLLGNYILAPLFVAFATYTSLYPIMLLVPVLLLLKDNKWSGLLLFIFWAYVLGLNSYLVTGPNWTWLRATYLYVLRVEDYTPNIGLFWYYFLETFTHYRNFFLVALQLHTFSYVIPCTLRLKQQPVLLFWVLYSVITLFKPYPVVGDVLLQLSLLPLFYKLLFYMKANFVLLNVHIFTSLLYPVLWHTWVESGSGNANFVYSITLVYAIASGWLVSELAGCAVTWRYTDKHRVSFVPGNDLSRKPKLE